MEKICLSQRRIDEIKNVCRKYGNDPGELINILHGVQDTLGYLPKEVQELIALELGISAARVYGVVSFYSFFTMKPKGKYPISVCMGTACYVRGGEKVLDEFRRQLGIEVGGTTPDGLFSLDSLRCVGACGLAPVVMIGPRVYGRLKVTDVKGILDEIQALEKEIRRRGITLNKRDRACTEIQARFVPSGTKAASPTIGSTSPNEGPRNDPQSLDDRKQAFFPP